MKYTDNMKYTDFYKYLINENNQSFGKEGDDYVRPGSDLDPDMEIGSTNFPHGMGYPNYKPKVDDVEDFEQTCYLDHIIDVPFEHSDEDRKKRKQALYAYIKNKQSEYYQKYREEIDDMYETYVEDSAIIRYLPHDETEAEKQTVVKIRKIYSHLFSLIHHRDDATNELNFPLYVSLYDISRELGGYEEGGWWYDSYKLIDSIHVKNPTEVLPAAEKLYNKIHNFDGKPEIVIEKEEGSQSRKERPTYS